MDRVRTRVGTATKTFTYSGMGETIARTVEGSNTLTYIHTVGGGSPLAQKKGSAIRWYLRDTHGDVVGLITPTGGNQGTVAFDPWGQKLGTTGSETSAFGYQGDLTDQSTGQVDMQTRWYEPQIGRFTTRDVLFGDPLSPASLNQFAYTSGSPVTYWDPSGMGQCSQSNSCPRDEEGNQITGNPGAGSSYYGGGSGGGTTTTGCTSDVSCGGVVAAPQTAPAATTRARDSSSSLTGRNYFCNMLAGLTLPSDDTYNPFNFPGASPTVPCAGSTNSTTTSPSARQGDCQALGLSVGVSYVSTPQPCGSVAEANVGRPDRPLPERPGEPPVIQTGGPIDPNTGAPIFLDLPPGWPKWAALATAVAVLLARILSNVCHPGPQVPATQNPDQCTGEP